MRERFNMHVAIDARIPNKGLGGVQQVLITMAQGFRSIPKSELQRTWIVYSGTDWWHDFIPIDDQILETKSPFFGISIIFASRFNKITSFLFPLIRLLFPDRVGLDDILRAHQVDVVHVPFQDGIRTNLPNIYQPHDLQHEYLPEFFSVLQRRHRNRVWKARAIDATKILVASSLVAEDLTHFWQIPPSKIVIEPIPPPLRPAFVQESTNLNCPYIFYPAVFWQHKNHQNLIAAFAIMKKSGYEGKLLLSGAPGPTEKLCRKKVASLGLNDDVEFLGHLTEAKFSTLISNAELVAIPSLFEAASLVAWDAQRLKIPTAVSNIASFRNQNSDRSVYFDPTNPRSIASTILDCLSDTSQTKLMVESAANYCQSLHPTNYANSLLTLYLSLKN